MHFRQTMRTPNAIPLCFLGARAVLWSALLTACAALPAAAGSFAEPATVFYGKVLAAGSATPFLVTTGELAWTIRRADGAAVTLRTRLFPLNQGEYSYRLNVPHEALALGLSASSGSVPVAAAEQTQEHLQIQINGQTARLLGPSGAAFFAAQGRRAATYRLDLAVPLAAEDADGDGVPDWWERQHGADDPLADPDADGLRNAAEFRRGSDPTRDDRTPSVLSREIRAFAEGTSAGGRRGRWSLPLQARRPSPSPTAAPRQ